MTVGNFEGVLEGSCVGSDVGTTLKLGFSEGAIVGKEDGISVGLVLSVVKKVGCELTVSDLKLRFL